MNCRRFFANNVLERNLTDYILGSGNRGKTQSRHGQNHLCTNEPSQLDERCGQEFSHLGRAEPHKKKTAKIIRAKIWDFRNRDLDLTVNFSRYDSSSVIIGISLIDNIISCLYFSHLDGQTCIALLENIHFGGSPGKRFCYCKNYFG